jgi:hypothetical protein
MWIIRAELRMPEWGEVFDDPVVTTALLDRLLHHAVVIQIEGSSYRLRQHLLPANLNRRRLRHTEPAANCGTAAARKGS